MKILADTSVLIAALVPAHDHHARSFPWLAKAVSGDIRLVVAAQSLAESYAVLTSLPLRPRISPSAAARLIDESIVGHAQVMALDSSEMVTLVRDAARWELAGGVMHDAVIARVARKARVDRLITLNVAHFRRAWPDGADKIAAP